MSDPPSDRPGLPEELLATRPGLAEDEAAHHPIQGPRPPQLPKYYSRGLHDHIVQYVRDGLDPLSAAQACGITRATFTSWRRRAGEGDVFLVPLFEDIEQAEAEFEVEGVKMMLDRTDKDKFIERFQWYIERTKAHKYSKDVQLKVNGMIAEFMERLRAGLTPQEYMKVLALATGQSLSLGESEPAPALLTDGSEEKESS